MLQIVRPVVLVIAVAVAPTPTRAAPTDLDVSFSQIPHAGDGCGGLGDVGAHG